MSILAGITAGGIGKFGLGAAGVGFGLWNNRKNTQRHNQAMDFAERQFAHSTRSMSDQVQELKDAGLHPSLAVGGGFSGGQPAGSAPGAGRDQSVMEQALFGAQMNQMASERKLTEANVRNLNADTEQRLDALQNDSTQMFKAELENIKAQTANLAVNSRKTTKETEKMLTEIALLKEQALTEKTSRDKINIEIQNIMAEWLGIRSESQLKRLHYEIEKRKDMFREERALTAPNSIKGELLHDALSFADSLLNWTFSSRRNRSGSTHNRDIEK